MKRNRIKGNCSARKQTFWRKRFRWLLGISEYLLFIKFWWCTHPYYILSKPRRLFEVRSTWHWGANRHASWLRSPFSTLKISQAGVFGPANCTESLAPAHVETVSQGLKVLDNRDGHWSKQEGLNSFYRYWEQHCLPEAGFKIALESHRTEFISWLYHKVWHGPVY